MQDGKHTVLTHGEMEARDKAKIISRKASLRPAVAAMSTLRVLGSWSHLECIKR